MKQLIQAASILFLMSMINCSPKFELKEGDFLFQDMDCGPMCDAIEEVTQGIFGARLSHVGLVVLENDSFKVVEAISKGVVFTPLEDFQNRSFDANGNPKILVGRLKQNYQQLIPEALKHLEQYKSSPYNISYIMGNDSVYCSQLLYLIFKEANEGTEVFELAPMTFKPLTSDRFFPVWEAYYRELGIAIPEGEPGINPGGMSRSSYLEIIHSFGNPDGWGKQ
ncbi:MAG: YiiX/YebB-like N1pC/P60 family cysteine hydrolase [Prolixibacteraceae bacterium]